MKRTTSPRPGIYRCKKCRHTVVLLVVGRALCLPCGYVMERLPGDKEDYQGLEVDRDKETYPGLVLEGFEA